MAFLASGDGGLDVGVEELLGEAILVQGTRPGSLELLLVNVAAVAADRGGHAQLGQQLVNGDYLRAQCVQGGFVGLVKQAARALSEEAGLVDVLRVEGELVEPEDRNHVLNDGLDPGVLEGVLGKTLPGQLEHHVD